MQEGRNTDVHCRKSRSYEQSHSPSWLEDSIMAVTEAPRASHLELFLHHLAPCHCDQECISPITSEFPLYKTSFTRKAGFLECWPTSKKQGRHCCRKSSHHLKNLESGMKTSVKPGPWYAITYAFGGPGPTAFLVQWAHWTILIPCYPFHEMLKYLSGLRPLFQLLQTSAVFPSFLLVQSQVSIHRVKWFVAFSHEASSAAICRHQVGRMRKTHIIRKAGNGTKALLPRPFWMIIQIGKTVVLWRRKRSHTLENRDKGLKSWSRAKPTQTAGCSVLLTWDRKALRWDQSQGWQRWGLSTLYSLYLFKTTFNKQN